ncbi:threonine-phosphate decarboxylase [Trinickia dabaoshanensis]|uniref:threonine-phosphate decarboxylase n=1 Tax=Trinickia dabaoshanensis TaxID=564714 RepID=A0A2N7VWU2_9BURK|nr:threonine-phosphate decarboxylase CobD [Trinickia dabaoshanensis]PMS21620.1 threonine-phosphate decarboxylase [Trinickia dabaoshanensis]
MLPFPHPAPVPHGGNLGDAAARYGIAREQWIDLSTGINPHGYPVPPIDPQAWIRLPDDHDDLEAIAAEHYGTTRALAVAGTQAAIRMLPAVLPKGRVGVGLLTYGEYAPAFERAGFPVARFVTPELGWGDSAHAASFVLDPSRELPVDLKHLILVNPNNPGTERYCAQQVMSWCVQLAARGGTLVVDEAFIESMPDFSVARFANREALIVLRSIGKFYGLAGARVGFVLACERIDAAMRAMRGPWTVSGPARLAVRAALLDSEWQTKTRSELIASGERLADMLGRHHTKVMSTPLFSWVRTGQAERWQDGLARLGIWVRRFDVIQGIRFGLPADEAAWMRLDAALNSVKIEVQG